MMRIDIWSDIVCPWCFLGRRRLQAALARLGWGDDEVEVHWRAYQLDPSATAEPGDLKASIERKYGPGAFDGMQQRLTALGAAEGIDYRFDRALRVNTLDAHRLMAWAAATGGPAVQDQLQELLFRAYFEQGENVADHATLARRAEEAGLGRDEAVEVLATGAFADEVSADLHQAREREITGVPAFVIADRFLIPGAQEVDTMVSVLQRCRERLDPPAA